MSMNAKTPAELEKLLQDLQSGLFPRRKGAADSLRDLELAAGDFPRVEPARLGEFQAAVRAATAPAVDPALLKNALGLPRLVPGFIPLLLCLGAQLVGVLPRGTTGASLWAGATLFLGGWYFKCFTAGLKAQVEPARQAHALGRQIGLFAAPAAPPEKPAARAVAQQRIVFKQPLAFKNRPGSLDGAGLRTDCPHCRASLAEAGTGKLQVHISTEDVAKSTSLSCPHCGHALTMAELRLADASAPAAAAGDKKNAVYAGPPVRDLTQEGVVAQLVAQGWTPKEAEAAVQVALVMVSTLGAAQLNVIHQNPDPVTLDKLALKWAVHCVVHGARPRTG